MDKRYATIWDGEEFRDVAIREAKQLVKEDKAQNVSDTLVSATELKFRKEFTGYKTREIRAAPPVPPTPAPSAVEKEIYPPEVKTPPPVTPQPVSAKDWLKYRKMASDVLGTPFNKTTKADTLDYMEKRFGLEN